MASPVCSSGACTNQCQSGFADCDGNVPNGCEDAISSDLQNCGACGNVCPASGANVQRATCSAGACGLVCQRGFADCDGDPANGCEVNLNSDVDSCGACERSAPGART